MKFFKACSKCNQSGFTLIELLVAITIIAILAALGLSVYRSVYKSARDSRRMSDLRLIQSALEQYHGDQKFYPPLNPGGNCTKDGRFKAGCPLTDPTGEKTYFSQIPDDPISTQEYKYDAQRKGSAIPCSVVPNNICDSYCLYACLERSPASSPIPSNCSLSGCYNYALTIP